MKSFRTIVASFTLASGLTAVPIIALAAGVAAAAEHSHQHDPGVPAMDDEGKRLESYNMRHEMTAEMRAALRAKVALYRGLTDRELDMNMNAMGPNYEWYLSDPKLRGETGVLILSHGVGENSDRLLTKSFAPLAGRWPTAVAFGMAMMSSAHLQSAVDDLKAQGVRRIVLVDEGTTTEHNSLSRHWQYVFDRYPRSSYMDVPKVVAPGIEFLWAGHFADDPLVTDILYDNARAVGGDPANEVLIIVGHGPEDAADNVPDLAVLQEHVARLKQKKVFADVRLINLQDDAIVPVRESNVRKLRMWIKQANGAGHKVIVVAIAAASFGVQQHIKTDLRGLDYTFAERGLAEDPRFVRWMESEITAALTDRSTSQAAGGTTR